MMACCALRRFNWSRGVLSSTPSQRKEASLVRFRRVHRQVVIEAKVVEVRLDNTSQFGVNWTAVAGQALKLEQPFATTGGFQITATAKEINATINALATQGYVNVISSPTISTLNNQP